LPTRVTWRRSKASRNSASSPAMPRGDRSASGRMGRRWPPSGRVGTTQRWSSPSSRTTWRHSEPSIASPCSSTTTGPLPPVSWYSMVLACSSTSGMPRSPGSRVGGVGGGPVVAGHVRPQ
jgi:hypothetical protein